MLTDTPRRRQQVRSEISVRSQILR